MQENVTKFVATPLEILATATAIPRPCLFIVGVRKEFNCNLGDAPMS